MRKKTAAILFLGIVFLGGSLVYQSSGPVFAQTSGGASNGKTKVVKLVDGRTMTGVVTEKKDIIEVETKFGVVKFKRDQISSMEDVSTDGPSVDEYATRKAKVDPSNSAELYELARWVWDNHRKDQEMLKKAQADVQASLELNDSNERAKLLLKQINAALNQSSPAPVTTGNIIKSTGRTSAAAGQQGDMDKYLVSQEDIYWIRLLELSSRDNVSVDIKNNAYKRYIELMKGKTVDGWDRIGNDRKFMAKTPVARVQEILRNQFENTDLLKDIQITRDPAFMVDFRSKVWPMAKQYCAAPQCHGGPKPRGGFKLFVMPNNVKADYTNFVIMNGFRNKEGRRMLDRDDVNTSIFLQYGLNPKVARFVHPKVKNQDITVAFPTISAKNYKYVSNWLQSLTRPDPNYHLTYQVPFGMNVNLSGSKFTPSSDASDSDEKTDSKE